MPLFQRTEKTMVPWEASTTKRFHGQSFAWTVQHGAEVIARRWLSKGKGRRQSFAAVLRPMADLASAESAGAAAYKC
jgi:hypothetical protein